MTVDYTKEESINDRTVDIYMALWEAFSTDPDYIEANKPDEIGHVPFKMAHLSSLDVRLSPIATKFLGLSSAKKDELDAFQVDKGLGFSTFIWMLAERKATAEALKDVNTEAISRISP